MYKFTGCLTLHTTMASIEALAARIVKAVVPKSGRDVAKLYHLESGLLPNKGRSRILLPKM